MRRQSHIILLLAALIALGATTASAASYKVRKGDSLARIAKKNHVSVEALREANGLQGDALQVGMKLAIPAGGVATSPAKTESPLPATEWVGYHTVRQGDTFATIAENNGLSVEELKKLNPGKKTGRLKNGMRLRVKPASGTGAPSPTGTASVAPEVAPPPAEPVASSRPAASVPAPAAAAIPVFHTIRKGDTFAVVARANGLSVDALKRLNPGKDSRRLKIGMQLRVRAASETASSPVPARPQAAASVKPPSETVSAPAAAATATASASESCDVAAGPVYHKVRKGETYSSIASKYGVSVKTIKKLNHVKKAKKLKPGSRLLVRRGDTGGNLSADRRRELERILQNEASLTAEGAALAAAQISEMAPELLAAANDNALGSPIVEENVSPGITDRVIRIAKLMLDLPYRFGGTSLTGIDCSGYVQKVFGFLNLPLPRTAREQFAKGEAIEKEELATGDLVFFKTYARFPSHVGIYLGDNKFIHASSGDQKVKIDSLDTPYFLRRYIGARRLVTDPKGDEE